MVKCSASKCNNVSYNKTPGLSFHRFPKDNNLKNIWVQNMNRQSWQPTSSSVLCSKHFEPHVKDTSAFCTILRAGAIPTLFEQYSENEENLSTVISSRKRCANGKFVSLLQDVQNVPEPQPCSSTHKDSSHNCSDITKSIEDHKPAPLKVENLKLNISLKNKKIKTLQQKTRRLKSKVYKFSEIINKLKKKNSQVDVNILSNIPVNNKELFTRFLKKGKGAALEKTYSPELRSFALQLHFYSPRAYNYVRNTFNTVLPHPVTLSRWYKNVEAEPGFTTESFETLEALSKNSERKVFVNLSIDEMAIRKGLVWDGSENMYKGYVNTGSGISDDNQF